MAFAYCIFIDEHMPNVAQYILVETVSCEVVFAKFFCPIVDLEGCISW